VIAGAGSDTATSGGDEGSVPTDLPTAATTKPMVSVTPAPTTIVTNPVSTATQ